MLQKQKPPHKLTDYSHLALSKKKGMVEPCPKGYQRELVGYAT